MSGIPVLVEVDGLDILIVGGGPLAARRAETLLSAGARVRVVAVAVSAELEALRGQPSLSIEQREYVSDDIGDAALVLAATNDRAVNALVARDASRARRLINRGDVPDEGTCTMMAAHRAGSLVIGVSAGGVPGAATRIRDAIATRFDGRYARAIERLSALRQAMLARGDRAPWARAADVALGEDFCEAVEQGTLDERMAGWR